MMHAVQVRQRCIQLYGTIKACIRGEIRQYGTMTARAYAVMMVMMDIILLAVSPGQGQDHDVIRAAGLSGDAMPLTGWTGIMAAFMMDVVTCHPGNKG